LISADTGEVLGLVDLGSLRYNGLAFAVSAEVAGPLLEAWAKAPQRIRRASCPGREIPTTSASRGRALHLTASVAVLTLSLFLPGSVGAAARSSGDRALVRLLEASLHGVVAAGETADAGRGGPDAVQAQYDVARDFQEALRAINPVSTSCRRLFGAAQRLVAGEVAAAEAVDRLHPTRVTAAVRRVKRAEAELRRLPRACAGGEIPSPARPAPELNEPRSGEAFPGLVETSAPRGTTSADIAINGRIVGHASLRNGRAAVYLVRHYGRWNLQLRFRASKGLRVTAESRDIWLLPRSAAKHVAVSRTDRQLAAKLALLASGFPGKAGIWVEDLTTGASAGWNEDARFPAASTVKLAVLVAALRKFGPRPERSSVAYDLQTLAGWSSNLSANRLLRKLGGSETGGSQIAEATLRRLGARSSSYPGDYRVGTGLGVSQPAAGAPDPPPLVSQRVTTARDLGRILYLLQAAAMGDAKAEKLAGLSEHEARVGLALLLSSQPSGDNLGLFRPTLPTTPIAQKNGWLNDAQHTAAIIYPETGPKIVVLLTYQPGIIRPAAATVGAKLLKLLLKT
jgi:hypothetical protein